MFEKMGAILSKSTGPESKQKKRAHALHELINNETTFVQKMSGVFSKKDDILEILHKDKTLSSDIKESFKKLLSLTKDLSDTSKKLKDKFEQLAIAHETKNEIEINQCAKDISILSQDQFDFLKDYNIIFDSTRDSKISKPTLAILDKIKYPINDETIPESFFAFLSEPVQRTMRYALTFNDFMSNLEANHASRSAFESIQTSFRSGAEVVNAGVKQFKFREAYKKYIDFKVNHPVLAPHDFKVSVSGIKDEEKNILQRMNNVQIIFENKEYTVSIESKEANTVLKINGIEVGKVAVSAADRLKRVTMTIELNINQSSYENLAVLKGVVGLFTTEKNLIKPSSDNSEQQKFAELMFHEMEPILANKVESKLPSRSKPLLSSSSSSSSAPPTPPDRIAPPPPVRRNIPK